jgi:hypothetical protein
MTPHDDGSPGYDECQRLINRLSPAEQEVWRMLGFEVPAHLARAWAVSDRHYEAERMARVRDHYRGGGPTMTHLAAPTPADRPVNPNPYGRGMGGGT